MFPDQNDISTALDAVLGATDGHVTVFEMQRHKRLLAEMLRRKCEALKLYEPLPHQEAYHASTIRKVIMQKGNQVGGTLAGAVEVARAVTGTDPYHKYPKRDGVVACLGYGEGHIGVTFYPKLFREGAFDVIRDLETKEWRTYRPWPMERGGDLERSDEIRPAPPLIPPRFLAEPIAWTKRSERIFSVARFTTGWELRAYNSAGDAHQAQGFQADLYWFDEDLATTGWVIEAVFRLLKRRGFLRWTALPHGENDEMLNLLDDADKQVQRKDRTTAIIRATTYDNKYLTNETLLETVDAARAQGEGVYRQRILGELNIDSVLMYPTFSRRIHDVMNVKDSSPEAQRVLAERMGEPPNDWTRYAVIDPGASVLAIVFFAVPPPELGDHIFAFDECYLRDPAVPSEAFGDAMQMKCSDRVFEAFLIDMHGGRLRGIASGDVPIDKYSDALQARGVVSESTKSGFRAGCDDIKRREEELRNCLSISRSGTPKLMIVMGKCQNLASEIERFRKKTVRVSGKDIPIDEGIRRGATHAVECLEMAMSSSLSYVKPRIKHEQFSIVKRWNDFRARLKEKRRMRGVLSGGNHISLGPLGVSS